MDIGGHRLRVNRARGELPKWQQGPTHSAPRGGLGAGRSLTMPFEEHPKVPVPRHVSQRRIRSLLAWQNVKHYSPCGAVRYVTLDPGGH